MKFSDQIRPIDKGVSKTIILGLAVIVIALGAAIFSFTYLLASSGMSNTVYGIVLIWIGSMAFFYAVITEEHTMKELFLRQSYFFTGLLVMILGMFFVSLSGLSPKGWDASMSEFGVLLLILGAGLTLLSAQRTRDYSKQSGFFAVAAGVLLIVGGLMAGNKNIAYAGVFITIFAGLWLGLRDRYAQ